MHCGKDKINPIFYLILGHGIIQTHFKLTATEIFYFINNIQAQHFLIQHYFKQFSSMKWTYGKKFHMYWNQPKALCEVTNTI